MLTEIDRNRDDRKQQCRKEKRTEKFSDDIPVDGQQRMPGFGDVNIGV